VGENRGQRASRGILGLSRPQLLDLLRRHNTGLHRIIGELHDEIALLEYRNTSGTGPDEFEKGRLDGTTGAARIAAAALHGGSEYAYIIM
jgi:hypothetical protein